MTRNANDAPLKKKRRLHYALESHLSRLGFTSNQIPTLKMAEDAYNKAMTLDTLRLAESVRKTFDAHDIRQLRRESDDASHAYTKSLEYIKNTVRHLSRLGFTSNKMPTLQMVEDAYKKAMTLDADQLYESMHETCDDDLMIKLMIQHDKADAREAYTKSFEFIKAAMTPNIAEIMSDGELD